MLSRFTLTFLIWDRTCISDPFCGRLLVCFRQRADCSLHTNTRQRRTILPNWTKGDANPPWMPRWKEGSCFLPPFFRWVAIPFISPVKHPKRCIVVGAHRKRSDTEWMLVLWSGRGWSSPRITWVVEASSQSCQSGLLVKGDFLLMCVPAVSFIHVLVAAVAQLLPRHVRETGPHTNTDQGKCGRHGCVRILSPKQAWQGAHPQPRLLVLHPGPREG